MKAWLGVAGLAIVLGGWLAPPKSERSILFLAGDWDGNLAPCGCTKPMSGGVLRFADAIRKLSVGTRARVLVNSGLVAGTGRQDELKAEALAEVFRSIGAGIVHFGPTEAALGRGMAESLQNLSGGRFRRMAADEGDPVSTEFVEQAPFLVGVAEADADQAAISSRIGELIDEARIRRLDPAVLVAGGEQDAEALAERFPGLAFVQYRSSGDPPSRPHRLGKTWLFTPGSLGKQFLRLVWQDGELRDYRVIHLDPNFANDPSVKSIYSRYLRRVDQAGLLDQLPRTESSPFAGSAACANCHGKTYRVWKATGHAHALATLEADGHGRDPDCVGCHVVGLERSTGFRARLSTPNLANVGCESCHGPSRDHARNPRTVPLAKVGEAACRSCHTAMNSPGFAFKAYWAKIRH